MRYWAGLGHGLTAWIFVAIVLVQVFLAGLAVFGDGFSAHVAFGYSAVWIVAILIPVLAFAGGLPRGDRVLSVLLLALYIPQCLLPPIARSGGPAWIAAFHPVNALLLFGIGALLAWRSVPRLRAALTGREVDDSARA